MKFIKDDLEITENNPNHFIILERAGFKKVEDEKPKGHKNPKKDE